MQSGAFTSVSSDPYAAWAPLYASTPHNPLMEAEQRAVLALLPPLVGCTVLDAGCGTGRYGRVARAAGATRVIGVDRSAAMLEGAGRDGWLVRGDVRALPLVDRSCDVIVSGLMLPDLADLAETACEWRRVVRPGGVIVCSTLHPVGAELGWTRTFDTPHGRRTLPAHWHTLADHQTASAAAGLIVDAFLEPVIDSEQCTPTSARLVPAALVVRLRRPG